MHARPRLNLFGRQLLIDRLAQGWSPPAVAESAGVSRATVYKWLRRYRAEGLAGLADRSSRPRRSPRRLDATREATVLELRRCRLGPHRLAALSGLPRSTCYRVLRRHQLHRLDGMDRPTGRPIRRYEMSRPGELGHMDVKKLARIPDGGGHFVHGRQARPRRDLEKRARLGYDYVHTLIDDHSRLAFSELLGDETASTVGQFVRRALAWFAARGVRFQAVMTDNAWAYRYGRDYQLALAEIGARRVFIPPYNPQINGKVERFNRTLLEEWAYSQPFSSNQQRHRLLEVWLHRYNYHRTHTALEGRSPIDRVNNLCGNYSLRGRAGWGHWGQLGLIGPSVCRAKPARATDRLR
jgi:transposase InsO family protein